MPRVYCADTGCIHNQDGECQETEISYAFGRCQSHVREGEVSTLADLAVGKCFKMQTSGVIYKKISNVEVTSKIGTTTPNAINLINGHRVMLRTDLPIECIPCLPEVLDKEEDKVRFAELPVGSKFRWATTCGTKVANIDLPDDWAKHPGDFPPNHINLDRNSACLMSPEALVIPLE
jgi:hypothetical protein